MKLLDQNIRFRTFCAILFLAFGLSGGLVLSAVAPPDISRHKIRAVFFVLALMLTTDAWADFHVKWLFHPIVILQSLLTLVMFFGVSSIACDYGQYKAHLMVWNLIPLFATYFVIRDIKQFKVLIAIMGFFLVLGFLMCFATDQVQLALAKSSLYRFRLGEPIGVSRNLGMLFIIAIFLRTKPRFLSLIIAFGAVAGIIMTGTRVSLWCLIPSVFFSLGLKSKLWLKYAAISLAILFFVLLGSEYFRGVTDPGLRRIRMVDQESITYSKRWDKWYDASKMWSSAPITGHGTGEYAWYSLGYDVRYYPHNLLLESLAENGLLGGLLIVGLCYVALRISFASRKDDNEFDLSSFLRCFMIYGILIACFSSDIPNQFIFWDGIAFCLASTRWTRSRRQFLRA